MWHMTTGCASLSSATQVVSPRAATPRKPFRTNHDSPYPPPVIDPHDTSSDHVLHVANQTDSRATAPVRTGGAGGCGPGAGWIVCVMVVPRHCAFDRGERFELGGQVDMDHADRSDEVEDHGPFSGRPW